MGAEPMLELRARDRQRLTLNRFVGLGFSPVLLRLGDVERRKPDGFGGGRAQLVNRRAKQAGREGWKSDTRRHLRLGMEQYGKRKDRDDWQRATEAFGWASSTATVHGHNNRPVRTQQYRIPFG